MYCVYDNNNDVVAFHDEYDVVETYIRKIKISNPTSSPDLHIGKIKKKKIKNMVDLDNLYLVRFGDTYVQNGYLGYLDLISSQSIYDNKQCKDVLLKILECNPISAKERKAIEKTVEVIDRFLTEAREFTPTLNELKVCEADYAPYLYNKFNG
jgi:hypothetical protein